MRMQPVLLLLLAQPLGHTQSALKSQVTALRQDRLGKQLINLVGYQVISSKRVEYL